VTMQTGPKTPAGKMRSRRNSLKHGVTAKYWIDHEELIAFKYYQQELIKEHGAKTTTELMYVDNIAHAYVKKQRVQKTEAAQWKIERELSTNNLAKLVELYGIDDVNEKKEIISRLLSKGDYKHGLPLELIDEVISHSQKDAKQWGYLISNMPLTKAFILAEAKRRDISIFDMLASKGDGYVALPKMKILVQDQDGNITNSEPEPTDEELLKTGYKLSEKDISDYLRGIIIDGRVALITESFSKNLHLVFNLADAAMPSQQNQELINRYERQADKQIRDNLTMLLQLIERREKRENKSLSI
jgi:hypothetical protein